MITQHPSTPTTNLEIASADLPSWIYATGTGNSFLLGFWFRRDNAVLGAGTSFRCPLFIANAITFRVSSTACHVRMIQNAADTASLTPSFGGDINDEWVFCLLSVNKTANTMSVCFKSSFGRVFSTAAANFATGTHTPVKLSWGENMASASDGGSGSWSAWCGQIGPIVLKNLEISTQATLEAIVDAIYSERYEFGMLDYRANGLNGINDTDWMAMNIGVPQTVQTTLVAGAASGARMGSAIVGGANTNYCWAQNGFGDAGDGLFNMARPITVNNTVTFMDSNDPVAGWFQPRLPGITTNGVGSVNSPLCRRLYDDAPLGRERVWAISNSRGQRVIEYDADGDSDQLWHNYHQNHAHGYVAARFTSCCGYMSAFVNNGVIERRFAFDCDAAPYESGTVEFIHGTAWEDFERACNGNGNATSTGPGKATRLAASAALTVRFRDTPGSLFTKDKDTTLTVRYLNYPAGAGSTFSWSGVTHTSQAGVGTGTGQSGSGLSFDTTTNTRVFGAGDTWTAGTRTMVIQSSLFTPTVGDLCYIASGTGAGSLAEVESASTNLGVTTVVFKHAFGTGPGTGSVLNFGPWSFGTFGVTLAARAAEFAGVNITNGTGGSLMLVSADAETDDTAGWVFGDGGWSGNGYGPQFDEQFTDAFADLAASLQADAVFLHNATQSSTTADRKVMADSIQAGVPSASIVYAADQMHDVGDAGTWQDESLTQTDYAAVVGTEDSRLGDTLTQLARGQKSNFSHPSVEGMYLLALANIDQMAAFENLQDTIASGGDGRLGRVQRVDRVRSPQV